MNNEIKYINRKAHLFWENPTIDAKINELMHTLSFSGKAQARLVMSGDSKDSRCFYGIKRMEDKEGITWELSFVDSLFMMHILREKILKVQTDIKAHQGVQQYTHNFGEFIFTRV